MSQNVNVTINGKSYSFPQGYTILQACKESNVYIPTLCYHPDLPEAGKCGLCVVMINETAYAYACVQKIAPNMHIDTVSPEVFAKARIALNNFIDLYSIPESKDIEDICKYLNPKNTIRNRNADHSISVMFNPSECINCDRCTRACSDVQNIGALNELHPNLRTNECISCGLCIMVCPTRALEEVSSIPQIYRALAKRKTLILQIAPSVRVSLGELFGNPPGTVVTGKIIAAARQLGFSYVFDTNFGADMTIVEEGQEFLKRFEKKVRLPQFTSCCPAWVNFVEKLHPELIPHLSSTKSPHMIVGTLVKTYFASIKMIDPDDIFLVSLMPCVAKKDEIARMQHADKVDAVITTREFAKMIQEFEISFNTLKDSDFDKMMGSSSGGGNIFGVTGGVTESCLRYLYQEITHTPLRNLEFKQLQGLKAIREATIKIGDNNIKVAVCSGIAAAREFIESEDYKKYHFIEVMACPGGCAFGGGQPKYSSRTKALNRIQAIRNFDANKEIKVCSDNPEVKDVYENFLISPGS
ncbi:NADP-reducing hydrogenase subunit HndC [Tritrichomonas foetus]|uniref:NADP-reducing hydrogenase subunit HndC n=1 Tax=Tritrichomonas foetus TaxID=1144522 RepID=A0A1J4JIC0_9EUKA|nr:NADP-reducing hydrogenase subunit HndC [Tritrichomonas foetus]|eukprot:OHS98936.1 NADP-reducing hydrogenase subunit HndC [Tritrichomonas foetus]